MGNRGPFRRSPLGRLRHGGFKTVELNAAGWSAMVGSGITAAALLYLITGLAPVAAAMLGVLGTWVVLLALDHYRWRNLRVSISRGELGPEDYQAAAARLSSMGIQVEYREDLYREHIEDESGEIQGALECREADAEVVTALLDELAAAHHS